MLGFAVLASISVIMLVGTSSASAGSTDLCSSDPAGGACPAGTSYALKSIHLIDPLHVLLFELLGVHKEILCQVLFQGEVLHLAAAGAGGQVIHGEFKYSLPHSTTGKCLEMLAEEHCGTVQEVGTPGGLLKVLRTANELGTAVAEGFEVLVECGGIHCVYNYNGITWHVLGALSTETISKVSVSGATVSKVSGFFCPSTAKLTNVLVPLAPFYLGV
jgi:hypothetical protein